MKLHYLLILLLAALLGGCRSERVGHVERVEPAESRDFREVRRADEWRYDLPDGEWQLAKHHRNQHGSLLERVPVHPESTAYSLRVTEQAWFGETGDELMAAQVADLRSGLAGNGRRLEWEIISERSDGITALWSLQNDPEGKTTRGIHRFRIGNDGVYSLAVTASGEAPMSGFREEWGDMVEQAALKAYEPKAFVILVQRHTITDRHKLQGLNEIKRSHDEAYARLIDERVNAVPALRHYRAPGNYYTETHYMEGLDEIRKARSDAIRGRIEELIDGTSAEWQEQFVVGERERISTTRGTVDCHLALGFYERHLHGVNVEVRVQSEEWMPQEDYWAQLHRRWDDQADPESWTETGVRDVHRRPSALPRSPKRSAVSRFSGFVPIGDARSSTYHSWGTPHGELAPVSVIRVTVMPRETVGS